MNLNRKKQWYLILGGLTGVFLLLAIVLGQDWIGWIINTASILVMAALIGIGIGIRPGSEVGVMQLIDAADDLRRAGSRIRELAEDPETDVDEALRNSQSDAPLFTNESLNRAFMAHRSELDRLYRTQSDFRYADIADHINQELLNHVGNAPYNDLIAGAMTGMGILGTFIGLMFGLREFDPSSAETMMETIPPLIDGIKIAFLTSIFGVIYSIVFNLLHRVTTEDASGALEAFTNAYYEAVLPRPENDGFTKLIQYQQSQTESMAQFAEQISLTMANALSSSVVPAFDRISQTIDALSDRLVQTQDQNMERIASEFVENMDKAMGSQMHRLGDSIRMICDWQEGSMAKMDENIAQLERVGEHFGGVCTDLKDSIAAMEGYLLTVESMQTTLKEGFETVISDFRQTSEEVVKQRESLTRILDAQEQTLRNMEQMEAVSAKRLEEEQKAIAQYRADVTKFCQELCGTIEISVSDMTDSMNRTLNAQVESIGSSLSTMEQTQKAFTAEMQKASGMMTDSVARMTGAVASSARDLTDSMSKAVDRQVARSISCMDESRNTFVSEMQKASQQMTDSVTRMTGAVETSALELAESMSIAVSDQIQSSLTRMSETQDTFLAEMEKATDLMNGSVEKMTGAVEATARDLTESMSKAISEQVRSNVSSLQSAQDAFAKEIRSASAQLTDCADRIGDTVGSSVREVMESMALVLKEQVKQLKDSAGNLETTQKTFTSEMQKASDQLGKSAGKISKASEDLTANLDKAMYHTYEEIDRQLANAVGYLSGTTADIREVAELVPRTLRTSYDQMQKNTVKYLSDLNATQQKMLEALKAQNNQSNQNKDRR